MDIEPLLNPRFLRRAVSIFKALADENRLALLLMLDHECAQGCEPKGARAQRTLADAGRRLGITKPTISHHLKQLRQAGLIACTRSGRRVQCATDLGPLQEILAALAGPRATKPVRR